MTSPCQHVNWPGWSDRGAGPAVVAVADRGARALANEPLAQRATLAEPPVDRLDGTFSVRGRGAVHGGAAAMAEAVPQPVCPDGRAAEAVDRRPGQRRRALPRPESARHPVVQGEEVDDLRRPGRDRWEQGGQGPARRGVQAGPGGRGRLDQRFQPADQVVAAGQAHRGGRGVHRRGAGRRRARGREDPADERDPVKDAPAGGFFSGLRRQPEFGGSSGRCRSRQVVPG